MMRDVIQGRPYTGLGNTYRRRRHSVTWLTIPMVHRTHLARPAATVRFWRATPLVAFAVVSWACADTDTGADSEVLIGPSFHPFYASDRGKDLGVSTRPSDQWRLGGRTVVRRRRPIGAGGRR
jgi:hypothetical protein